jgi:OOP family OmpA-OmpF porin
MRNTTLLSTLLLSSTFGAMAFGANAQDHGFYSGVGTGQSHIDEGSYNDRDRAFSVFGGYDFNKYIGVEAGYADLGRLEYVGEVPLEATAPYLVAMGKLPITEKVALYAKAGINHWSLEDPNPSLTATGDDSGTDATYGLGVQYRINDRFALRGDYSRLEVGEMDIDVAQVQAVVRF